MSINIPNAVIKGVGIAAVLFGIATIVSGGNAILRLHGVAESGDKIVPFVLYLNFVAGFAYITSGVGLFRRRSWASTIAIVIAVASLVGFIGLGVWILLGNPYEMRTVIAMSLRTAFWFGVSVISSIGCREYSIPLEAQSDASSNYLNHDVRGFPRQDNDNRS